MTAEAFRQKIRGMAAPANPTEAQVEELIKGWIDYFTVLYIPEDQWLKQFEDYMRMRVWVGSISLVAPKIALHLGAEEE